MRSFKGSEIRMFTRWHGMSTSPGHEDDDNAHIGDTAMFQTGRGNV